MKKIISKIQFITHADKPSDYLKQIKEVCDAGVELLQLRAKNLEEKDLQILAEQTKRICTSYGITLIINDYVNIAFNIEADGVHLGKKDMNPAKARLILGQDAIIGCTANNFSDIVRLVQNEIDYIGLGPFSHTSTKEQIDKILGIETVTEIIKNCNEQRIEMPIIAVGGIKIPDVQNLFDIGIHGIAISGLIANAKDKTACVNELKLLSEPLIGA